MNTSLFSGDSCIRGAVKPGELSGSYAVSCGCSDASELARKNGVECENFSEDAIKCYLFHTRMRISWKAEAFIIAVNSVHKLISLRSMFNGLTFFDMGQSSTIFFM